MKIALAILRKDLILLWPMALIAVALIAGRPFAESSQMELVAVFLPIASFLVTALLVIGLVQTDAPSSLSHDWLTRPIARREILIGKAVFLFVVVYIPYVVGTFAHGLASQYSAGEAFARALAMDSFLMIVLIAGFLVGAVTSSFIEAAGAAVAMLVLGILLLSLVLAIGTGEAVFFTGSGWVVSTGTYLVFAATVGLVLWLMYGQRKVVAARLVLAGASTLAIMMFALPWPAIYAIQRAVAGESESAGALVVRMPPDCFRTAVMNPGGPETPGPQYTDPNYTGATALTRWEGDQRIAAGPNAISFTTDVRVEGVPAGWRALVAHVTATLVDPRGRTIGSLRAGRETAAWSTAADGTPVAVHAFLLPRADYERYAAENARLHLDYSVSLLRPGDSIEVAVGGERRRYPGLGYCGASMNARLQRPLLECFIHEQQPALLVSQPIGTPGDGQTVNAPDYRPGILRSLRDHEYAAPLPQGTERIRLTVFDDAAHFGRRVEVDGVLGGPASACPPPAKS